MSVTELRGRWLPDSYASATDGNDSTHLGAEPRREAAQRGAHAEQTRDGSPRPFEPEPGASREVSVKRYDWPWLRDKFRFRWGKETLEVFQDNEGRFKLDGARGFTLDLRARVARRDERTLASFDEIEGFVVEVRENRDVGDTFRLILGRVGKCDMFIGDTKDQLNCSWLAARMSTLTGKPVVARRALV